MIDEDKVNWILLNEKYKELALIAFLESNKLNENEKKLFQKESDIFYIPLQKK